MIKVTFKGANEVTLRCALHARGLDPETVDEITALAELLTVCNEEIRRNQPPSGKPAPPLPGQTVLPFVTGTGDPIG